MRRSANPLRADDEADEWTYFLKERQDELARQLGSLAAAIKVLDDKNVHYGMD